MPMLLTLHTQSLFILRWKIVLVGYFVHSVPKKEDNENRVESWRLFAKCQNQNKELNKYLTWMTS